MKEFRFLSQGSIKVKEICGDRRERQDFEVFDPPELGQLIRSRVSPTNLCFDRDSVSLCELALFVSST